MNIPVQNHLIELEKSLMSYEVRSSWEKMAILLHDDFLEISQSGSSFGKQEVLEAFRDGNGTSTKYDYANFSVRFIDENFAQVFYETNSIPKNDVVPRIALRSSLWKFEDNRWQMVFHQGTIKR